MIGAARTAAAIAAVEGAGVFVRALPVPVPRLRRVPTGGVRRDLVREFGVRGAGTVRAGGLLVPSAAAPDTVEAGTAAFASVRPPGGSAS